MRSALNDNPLVQIAVLGAMAAVLAVVFLIGAGGGAEDTAPPAGSGSGAAVQAPAPDSGATTDAPPVTGAASLAPSGASGGTLEAGPGLPAAFVRAHTRGRPVALFVYRQGPETDRTLAAHARRLRAEGGAKVLTIDPSELADWVRVTGPVGLDRTPALIVVAPGDAKAPAASIHYGFRGYDSVRQALADALYEGPRRGYDPG